MPDFITIYTSLAFTASSPSTFILLFIYLFFIPFVSKKEFRIKILYNAEIVFLVLICHFWCLKQWLIPEAFQSGALMFFYYRNMFFYYCAAYYVLVSIAKISLAVFNIFPYNIGPIFVRIIEKSNMNIILKVYLIRYWPKVQHVIIFILISLILMCSGFDLFMFCDYLRILFMAQIK